MIKLFQMIAGLLGNIDKLHGQITAAYKFWEVIYGFVQQIRGISPTVPAVTDVAPATEPVTAPAPAPLPDAAYTDTQAAVDAEKLAGNGVATEDEPQAWDQATDPELLRLSQ
jgi:hypothetical protein